MATATKTTEGFVYVLFAPSINRLKIGFTVDLEGRVKKLRYNSPVDLEFKGSVKGTLQVETMLLAAFDCFRTHSEWFDADPRLVSFLEELLKKESVTPLELLLK